MSEKWYENNTVKIVILVVVAVLTMTAVNLFIDSTEEPEKIEVNIPDTKLPDFKNLAEPQK